MSLFWKIFLWFLLAMSAVVGASVFVNWSIQNEPNRERWQLNGLSTVNIYSYSAQQIINNQGEEGLNEFVQVFKANYPTREICFTHTNSASCPTINNQQILDLIFAKVNASDNAVFEARGFDENYAAKKFPTKNAGEYILVLKLDFPRPPPPFGFDWMTRIFRILAILLTAGILCYALVLYLVNPIIKLRQASKTLANGDFHTRIESKRRDELGELARDFDEMAERIELLISSQRRLTRDISHELRSPLARMNVALELAKTKSNSETQSLIHRIELESQRLNEMISNILILSKLESKSEIIEKSQVNLHKLVENIVEDTNFEAEAKGKSVYLSENDESILVGNERLLRSAVENVIRNAIRYTKDRVDVSLVNEGKIAKIIVTDNGSGIPEKELKEIFRPFYRVSEARERKSGGIGIGLSITEQAVNAHNGTVSAMNVGDGLQVEIKLPLNDGHL